MKEPRISTPTEVFSPSNIYLAPVFQRMYVWQEKDWNSLLEELEESTKDAQEFVGAIVLRDLGKPKGTVSPNTYLIIDGQQRLTTLYLLLAALSQVAREGGNGDMATYILENFLALTRTPGFRGRPKLVPTLQDRYWMREILRAAQPGYEWDWNSHLPESNPPSGSLLYDQWHRILAYCRASTLSPDGTLNDVAFQLCLSRAQEGLRFIEIILDGNDDANAIFSSLNAKGQPLALVDLVRNEVFHNLQHESGVEPDAFFKEHWRPFENRFAAGTLSEYFPVYAQVFFEGKVAKSRAFPELQRSWRKRPASSILAELSTFAPYFQALSGVPLPSTALYAPVGSELRRRIDRFSRMPRSLATWPFLVRLLHEVRAGTVGQETGVEVLELLEAYLVRRLLVGVEPTGIQVIFKRMWAKVGAELMDGNPRAILKPLEAASQDAPTDERLLHVLTKERSDKRAVLRFFLEEYELHLTRSSKGDPSPPRVETIEHILPQHPSDGTWQDVPATTRSELVGLLGNLAPLSGKQNAGLGNSGWSQKRERFLSSNYKTVRAVSGVEQWTAAEIMGRTNQLAEWAIARWKIPAMP